MKNGRFNSMLLFFVVSLTISCTAQTTTKLSPQEFSKQIINEENNYMILDVRTNEEVELGKIPGAVQLNFYDENFNMKLNQLDKKTTYYVYCASGGRSGKTLSMMTDQGFKKVYDLEGGMNAWLAAGLQVN